jgi:hypothetical protein
VLICASALLRRVYVAASVVALAVRYAKNPNAVTVTTAVTTSNQQIRQRNDRRSNVSGVRAEASQVDTEFLPMR